MKSKSIVLVSIGEKGYIYMAYNLAYSIKHHNESINIHLIADGSIEYLPPDKRTLFDTITPVEFQDYHVNGTEPNLDPGRLKTRIYKYLKHEHNLYVDVDSLALCDLMPSFDKLCNDGRFYITSEQGRGKITETIRYSEWATNETMKRIYGLEDNQDLVAIQSSWCYIHKCKEAKSFFDKVSKAFDKIDMKDLALNWGGTIPDEMVFSGIISKLNMNVDGPKDLMFFGSVASLPNPSDMEGQYDILSIYGNGHGRTMTPLRFFEYYDNLMFRWTRLNKQSGRLPHDHIFKTNIIKQYKHANKTKRQ